MIYHVLTIVLDNGITVYSLKYFVVDPTYVHNTKNNVQMTIARRAIWHKDW
jgi:hypothetical protein